MGNFQGKLWMKTCFSWCKNYSSSFSKLVKSQLFKRYRVDKDSKIYEGTVSLSLSNASSVLSDTDPKQHGAQQTSCHYTKLWKRLRRKKILRIPTNSGTTILDGNNDLKKPKESGSNIPKAHDMSATGLTSKLTSKLDEESPAPWHAGVDFCKANNSSATLDASTKIRVEDSNISVWHCHWSANKKLLNKRS